MMELAPTDKEGEFRGGFGGDTFNSAWYMRALRPDVRTRYFTGVGTDAVSRTMLGMMSDTGIDISHVVRVPDRSVGLYLITIHENDRSFTYWRDNSAARLLAADPALLTTATDGADIIYFSGITLAILDPESRTRLMDALEAARDRGALIAFDSNLRPRLWASLDDMTSTITEAASICDFVLPSFDDEAKYFGDTSIEAAGNRYLRAGAKSVVVKNGRDPVYYIHDGQDGHVTPPRPDRVVDTTSAGDSFNAGFFAGLDQPRPIEDLIASASQVAAQVIGQKGALVPLDLDGIRVAGNAWARDGESKAMEPKSEASSGTP